MKKYDVVVVGCGPAGIFTVLELLKDNNKLNCSLVNCFVIWNSFFYICAF